ncbi:MAG TPA: hypothetical protein VMS65_10315 [Polyangiaceae bacterium]|nr:hypothetical protein [Polyangiaceae bacterium]
MTGRWLLLALPVVTVAVVALALVTAAAPRPFRSARIWGGPTDESRVSLRVEIVDIVEESGEVVERAVANEKATVRFQSSGFEAARVLTLDAEGTAELALEPPRASQPFVVTVTQGGVDLALGPVALSSARWALAARRRGGWVRGHAPGGYDVRVAPERGAFAVPFEEGLWVEVEREGKAVAGVKLELSVTGGKVAVRERVTDERGRARFSLLPEEHTLGARVVIFDGTARSELAFGLPVVPGALRARRVAGELVIEAPVPREIAYFALVTETERLVGGRVALTPDAFGNFVARVPLPALPVAPTHAVVATDRDLRSAAAVGWPLVVRPDGDPPRTFDAVDALLLDGRARGAARETARRARVRWVTVAFCAIAVLLELVLFVFQARRRDRELDEHLERQGVLGEAAERLAPARSSALLLAIGAVALGFFLLALAVVLRLR